MRTCDRDGFKNTENKDGNEKACEHTAEGVNPSSRSDFENSEREKVFLFHAIMVRIVLRGYDRKDAKC
jgi:hypothetical protein